MTIKKIMITTTLMISTLFLTACGENEGEKFVGIWKQEKPEISKAPDGTLKSKYTDFYIIEKSGNAYAIHNASIAINYISNYKPEKLNGWATEIVSFKDGKLIVPDSKLYFSYIDKNTLMLQEREKFIRVDEVK